jgi:uncharacterized cupredoxin-like copper-binding protein
LRRFTIRWIFGAGAAAIAMLALSAHASARTDVRAARASTTVQVAAKEFSFKLSTQSIPKPATVAFSVKNTGKMEHDFKINGKQTPLIRPGKTSQLVVTFKQKGSYHYLCTVPGHAAAGMKGVFTVR